MSHPEFDALHTAMRAQVDGQFLPGVSTALLRGREVVDRFCCGFADKEAGTALREDHIHRIFSSTKLVTSCAVMLLLEEGRIASTTRSSATSPSLVACRCCVPARRVSTTPSRQGRRSRSAT